MMPPKLRAVREAYIYNHLLIPRRISAARACIIRPFSETSQPFLELDASKPAGAVPPVLDPYTVSTPREERQLIRGGRQPIGSRRRRAALKSSGNIPFEQLPYQCFQEARKFLQEDRREKIQQIEIERGRIERLKAQDDEAVGGALRKQNRIKSMTKHLENLKIFADINDPMVKKRFEDGDGDFNRPIYRYLAERKWRSRRRLILMQRITQMHVIPDVLPDIDPTVDVQLAFGRHTVQPGDFVESQVSARPPKLAVQVFDKGERFITVVVVDSDVPDLAQDTFKYRCHFIAANIPISPTSAIVQLQKLDAEAQVILPWLPPYAQKGAPYHRLSLFILEQRDGHTFDVAKARSKEEREGFLLRSFVSRYHMKPVGCFLFRTKWDEGTDSLMQELGAEGWDIQFKHRREEPLPPRKKDGSRYR